MQAAIWWENLMERDHLKGIDCRIILKLAVKKEDEKVGSGYHWLCIGTNGKLSYTVMSIWVSYSSGNFLRS
jgi:hypothetical protein